MGKLIIAAAIYLVADAQPLPFSFCGPSNAVPPALRGHGNFTRGWLADGAIGPNSISIYEPAGVSGEICVTNSAPAGVANTWYLSGNPTSGGYDFCGFAWLVIGPPPTGVVTFNMNYSGSYFGGGNPAAAACPPPVVGLPAVFAPTWTSNTTQQTYDCSSRMGQTTVPLAWQGSSRFVSASIPPGLSTFVVSGSAAVSCLFILRTLQL